MNAARYINGLRFLICIMVAGVFSSHITHWVDIPLLKRLDNMAYDVRLRLTMPNTIDPNIVILDIDEKSLAALGHWPWSRNILSDMVDILFDHYQIKLLAFDVTFPEADTSSGLSIFEKLAKNELKDNPEFLSTLNKIRPSLQYDDLFTQSLTGRNAVLGYYTDLNMMHAQKNTSLPKSLGSINQYNFSDSLLKVQSYGANLTAYQNATQQGGYFNNISVDGDGLYRRLPLLTVYNDHIYESLSFAIFRHAFPNDPIKFNSDDGYEGEHSSRLESIQIGERIIPVNAQATVLVPYLGKQGSFKYIPVVDVLDFITEEHALKDKIVILGSSAAGILDLRSTPVQHIYPGVEVHANLVSGLIDQRIKYQPSYIIGVQFIFIIILSIIGIAFFPKFSAGTLSALLLVLMSSIISSNFYLWHYHNISVTLATPLIFVFLLFTIQMTFSYLLESSNKKYLTGMFGQYIPAELVDKMVDTNNTLSMEPDDKILTVLFSDVRGFTTISEQFEADELAQLINEILTPITELIHENSGTIDKYMGDAVMAFWGAPVENEHHASKALSTALAITPRLNELNKEFIEKGWPEIKVGIGLNTGTMSVGNMGSEFRLAYTVLGDAVNLGSRIEGLTKQYGVDLLVTETTKEAAPEFSYKEMDKVKVKGKLEPVTIFQPIGLHSESTEQQLTMIADHSNALKYYHQQNWSAAKTLFTEFQQQRPDELINHIYLERIALYEQHPPEKGWDGSFTHTSK